MLRYNQPNEFHNTTQRHNVFNTSGLRVAATASVFATILLLPGVAIADGPPIATWKAYWQQNETEWALADLAAIGPDGETYISTRPQFGGGNGSGLLKYSSDGDLEWAVVLEEVPDGSEGFTDLEITAEGVSMVGVTQDEKGAARTVLLNYADDGNLLWRAETVGPAFPGMLQPQLAISSTGDRVIATDDGNGSGVLERYNAAGSLIHSTPLSFDGFGGVSALDLDPSGNAIVATLQNFQTYEIEKYDHAGNVLWSYSDSAEGLALSEVFLAVDASGGVAATGSMEMFDSEPLQLVSRVWRLDSDGALQWTNDSTGDFALSQDLALAEDGSVYIIRNEAAGLNLVRIDAAGNEVWSRMYDAGEGFATRMLDVDINSFGDVIVGAIDAIDWTFLGSRVLNYNSAGDLNWTGRVAEADGNTFFHGAMETGANGSVALALTQREDNGFDVALTVHLQFAACTGDLDGSGEVGVDDLLSMLAAWGACDDLCSQDLNNDGEVSVDDLLQLLASWGPC